MTTNKTEDLILLPLNPLANHLQMPVQLELIDFTVWVGKKPKFLTNVKLWKTSPKIISQNRMLLYNFPEGMFASNDSPVHHSISKAHEIPFPTPAWGVA